MLDSQTHSLLQNNTNLLAFSAGVDSSALLFILLENHIPFDIAIVNYNLRASAKSEVAYAQSLAQRYTFRCHVLDTTVEKNNLEAKARAIRYDFFHTLIREYHYNNLLTAHQLNDKLEWFLMQLSRGSSLHEMLGIQSIEQKEFYTHLRPLLHVSKESLYNYLHAKDIQYFEDKSNQSEVHTRNRFRHTVSNYLIEHFEEGIAKSFTYLHEDADVLYKPASILHVRKLYYFAITNRHNAIKDIDKQLKRLGYLLSATEREHLKNETYLLVSRELVIAIHTKYCFIAPHIQVEKMEKSFKETCRKLKIDKHLRGYLYIEEEAFSTVCELLTSL